VSQEAAVRVPGELGSARHDSGLSSNRSQLAGGPKACAARRLAEAENWGPLSKYHALAGVDIEGCQDLHGTPAGQDVVHESGAVGNVWGPKSSDISAGRGANGVAKELWGEGAFAAGNDPCPSRSISDRSTRVEPLRTYTS